MFGGKVGWAAFVMRGRVQRFLRPSLYDWSSLQVSFIISTGRTATKFLAKLLSTAFERMDARHEPSPDLFDIGTRFARSEATLEAACAELRDARLHICGQVRRSGCDHYIEANNNLAYLITPLRRLFPDARIIHLVRDGRDFVRSAYSKTARPGAGRGRPALVMSEEDHRRRLQASDLPDDPYRSRWPQMSRFERICWYWQRKDGIICEALRSDELALTVKFEDVFNQSSAYQGFWDMVNFLGLRTRLSVTVDRVHEVMGRKENATEEYLLPSWTDWSPEQARQFREIAGDYLESCGYNL